MPPFSDPRRPRGVWHSLHEIAEPEEFSSAVAGATLRADFLGARAKAAKIERFLGSDWAMDFFEAGVKARVSGPLVPGWTSLCLVLRACGSRWYGAQADDGWLLCNPPGVPIEGTIAPGFRGVSFAVPRNVWAECLHEGRTPDDGDRGFHAMRLPQEELAIILRELAETHRCLSLPRGNCVVCRAPARMGSRLARKVATIAGAHGNPDNPLPESARNRFRLARRAEEWMRAHVAESPAIPALCSELGTSRRELEYAFRSAFDQSPHAYLEAMRLNAARNALRTAQPGATVSHIAFAHGFHHLGRFAARFKALFGESPSAVLPSRH